MVARATVSTRTTLPLTPSSTISTNLAIAPSSKAERFQGARNSGLLRRFPRRCAAEPGGAHTGGLRPHKACTPIGNKRSAVLPEKTCPLPEDHLSSGNGLAL